MRTPLHYACYWGNPDLVTPLLEKRHDGAFINAQDRNGNTALHIASRYGHNKVVKELLKKNPDTQLKNDVSFVVIPQIITFDSNLGIKVV